MTATATQPQWEKLVRIPRGHRFFRDKLSGKVSVCDDSGTRPHLTDDGILWIQQDKPILLQEQFESAHVMASVFVTKDRTGESLSILSGPREVLWLIRNLGMSIKIQTVDFTDPDNIRADDSLDLVPGVFTKQFVPLH